MIIPISKFEWLEVCCTTDRFRNGRKFLSPDIMNFQFIDTERTGDLCMAWDLECTNNHEWMISSWKAKRIIKRPVFLLLCLATHIVYIEHIRVWSGICNNYYWVLTMWSCGVSCGKVATTGIPIAESLTWGERWVGKTFYWKRTAYSSSSTEYLYYYENYGSESWLLQSHTES